MPSVLNSWVENLPYMQQSVLLSLVRNEDGLPKHHPQKELTKWYRRCILKSAFDGAQLHSPGTPGGGSFTGPVPDIEAALDQFIWARDEMKLHYFAHAMHAFEILAYKYPDDDYREFWHRAYLRMVHALHMTAETEADMNRRLGDGEANWRAREDKCGGCTSTEMKPRDADAVLDIGADLVVGQTYTNNGEYCVWNGEDFAPTGKYYDPFAPCDGKTASEMAEAELMQTKSGEFTKEEIEHVVNGGTLRVKITEPKERDDKDYIAAVLGNRDPSVEERELEARYKGII